MTMRENFEIWYSDNGISPMAIDRLLDGEYKYMGTGMAWIAWKEAARVTLENAAVFFEDDENYRVCVDDSGRSINTPQQILRAMAEDMDN